MATGLASLLNIIAPKRKAKSGGQAVTPTYNPQSADRVLTVPNYRDHLTDVYETRTSDDSRDLVKYLFQHDPDVSAAVFSYQTLADTAMTILVRDVEGEIDRDATKQVMQMVQMLTRSIDYTLGFQLKPDLSAICEELRYMFLLRGSASVEVIYDKKMQPSQLRLIDTASLEWYEKKPGEYKPRQAVSGSQDGIDLDMPNVFVSYFRRDPTTIYSKSTFVAAINTIAARQQVVNDLYRIMRRTGYPRMAAKVLEEVLRKNAPEAVRNNEPELVNWMRSQMNAISTSMQTLRADDAFIHTDSVEPYTLNAEQPAMSVDISSVIETLNAQNQAGLKTMATVIGRGSQGVNTGSVEARIAAMNADQLNRPVAELLSDALSFMHHFAGGQGFVEVQFARAELRPEMELEAQRTMRAARLRKDLSDGLITDDEYHLMVYGRIRPDASPELSGTGFMNPAEPDAVNAEGISPNSDPLGRSVSSDGGNMAKSDAVEK